ncbi:hypothetical protein B0D71_20080 [Pseudomonas laurylsulfativorans]|uniref:Uncharacterized protein n=1 Tax=Pseudomonas laurylsulfativorans TaxID=1943631 RepID=A0A2S3VLD3_9PSED|nr:hypothetical protein B0D71_20080 [Pseudomonas laurylsulfativorans]
MYSVKKPTHPTKPKAFSDDETGRHLLAPQPQTANIRQKENIYTPPLKLKHSTTDTVLIA